MIKKKGPDRVMSQQRCEIQIGQAKQFGADGDLSGLIGRPYSTVQEPGGVKDGGVTHGHRCFISRPHVKGEAVTTVGFAERRAVLSMFLYVVRYLTEAK